MEIGIAPFGYNKNNGHCKSPYDLQCDSGRLLSGCALFDSNHLAGGEKFLACFFFCLKKKKKGSSSGSASAVGAGIVPGSIGADGGEKKKDHFFQFCFLKLKTGGSIRVPAAFCGIVGLKANVHRVPECSGIFPLCFSVGHIGPLASNVRDTYALYRTIQGPCKEDLLSSSVPDAIPRFSSIKNGAWRIGVCPQWIDLCKDESVRKNYESSIQMFEKQGDFLKRKRSK